MQFNMSEETVSSQAVLNKKSSLSEFRFYGFAIALYSSSLSVDFRIISMTNSGLLKIPACLRFVDLVIKVSDSEDMS